jgi:hypothetical protein
LLATGTKSIERYLQGPSLLPQVASYRSEQAPAVPPAQDFADAVRSDRTISDQRKQELLAM